MASIFTWEPDTPRVSSPWLQGTERHGHGEQTGSDVQELTSGVESISLRASTDGHKVTRLQAEPQEGPVEYKLHLLLRPRRKFRSTSTGGQSNGTKQPNFGVMQPSATPSGAVAEPSNTSGANTPPSASIQLTRQHRLEQLTTQLLWRLQQSSPHHTSSATNIILPSLPEALPELQAPLQPAKLLHGLEESQGALYEIGVSDDGILVGLAEDELLESLNNLRAMAACLGCTVEVLRKETVGECEWVEDAFIGRKERKVRRNGKLVVAEALVKPLLQTKTASTTVLETRKDPRSSEVEPPTLLQAPTEQLRITLTGPTMSGKSTLLGTLTTSTLDNGRGTSRLSMLKHRHEITSGVTSSVTQELLGYQDVVGDSVEVVNYATENIASWIDVHVAASGDRLVLLSDSAGHPRYRRTTVRSLVGWAPHWTLLCVPADDTEDRTREAGSTYASTHQLGSAVSGMDLSGAQLDLCLRLQLPLVIVITKLDLASRTGLKNTLSKVLDTLKAAGRRPAILPNSVASVTEKGLQLIDESLIDSAYNVSLPLLNDAVGSVPIVLTSAVQGTGIKTLHALLHELPIPASTCTPADDQGVLFHIEDVYSKPAEVPGMIISGYLRTSQLSVGDTITLGPFSTAEQLEDSEDSDERPARRAPPSPGLPASRSFPGALRASHLAPPHFQLPGQEWRRVKVISIRNLRLPVHTLQEDQVGTIAIELDDKDNTPAAAAAAAARHAPTNDPTANSVLTRIRKGMVLASSIQPQATRIVIANFAREDLESLAVGMHVVVYIASVRASARIVSARAPDSPVLRDSSTHPELELEISSDRSAEGAVDPFAFDDGADNHLDGDGDGKDGLNGKVAGRVTASHLLVTFRLIAAKEYVRIGDRMLVMPGGGPGLYGGHGRGEKGVAGLDGFVGRITETFG